MKSRKGVTGLEKKTYVTTPRLVMGCGTFAQAGEEMARLGASRVFVLTGGHAVREGKAGALEKALRDRGMESALFDGIEPDPSCDTLERALEAARKFEADAVVGLGGGSPLDMAKAVSVLLTNEGPLRSFFGVDLLYRRGLPKLLIPTTAGTGTEVTAVAIFSDHKEKLKMGIVSPFMVPDVAILDPELTLSVPPLVTAYTGMDALVHAMEAYTSVNATSLSDMYAERALALLFPHIRAAYADGRNLAARSAMMEGSMLAGKAFAIAGTTATHAFAYPIGAEFPIPHGMANALMVVEVFQFNLLGNLLKFARIADLAGEAVEGLPLRDAAQGLVESLRRLVEDLRLPTRLRDFGVKKADIPRLAAGVLKVTRIMANNPRRLELEDAEEIYRRVL
ncbi:MAG TPA: iron-containing alcohol dehydrogenase [Synergistaceae bacterium]|nr:iron-containing alcohol dehydrogenase [Synergistaceae bacterium]HQH77829.1 iron-containing alcohol dehydrogenase [Synergistaceae bacterium]HQK25319.1 iron-containing alcohol dehydrogenase [Synergistaceae bacterium]